MKKFIPLILVFGLLCLSGSLFTLHETEQAVVIEFGKPVGNSITSSGLHFKLPLIQTVIKFDKRIIEWDGAKTEIPTKDNKYILIDSFARWRISDALAFYKSAKNEMLAQSRLDDIINGSVRDEISIRSMEEIIRSTQRKMETYDAEGHSVGSKGNLMIDKGARLEIVEMILLNVTNRLNDLEMGIEIVDVQLKRINYNSQVQSKLFNRMISEQNMIAEKYRGQGQGKKQEILGMQIQKEKEIVSDAYLKSQKIKGAADGEVVKIYADSYNQAPEFFVFKKTLESYEKTLDSTTQLILSTDSNYLRYLNK